MSERNVPESLTKETLAKVRELDAYARGLNGTVGESPYTSPIVFIDDANDTFDLRYFNKQERSLNRTRTVLYNSALRLVGQYPFVGENASVDRKSFATGEKDFLYLSNDVNFNTISDAIFSKKPLTKYDMSLSRYGKIAADDPRVDSQLLFDSDKYYRLEGKPTVEEQEEVATSILALTPDHFYQSESPKPTAEQEKMLYEASRASIFEMFSRYGVDTRASTESYELSFKVGTEDDHAIAKVHYQPYTLRTFGTSFAPATPDKVGQFFSPTAFVRFVHNDKSVLSTIPLNNNGAVEQKLKARVSLDKTLFGVELDSFKELSYIAGVLEDLGKKPDYGILTQDTTNLDLIQLQSEFQPFIEEDGSKKDRLIDFIDKHA